MKHITEHSLKGLLRKGRVTVENRMMAWGFNSMMVGFEDYVEFHDNTRGYASVKVFYSEKGRVKKIITENVEIGIDK